MSNTRHAALLAQSRASRPPPGLAPAVYVERAAIAATIAACRVGANYPGNVARELFGDDDRVTQAVLRGATAPASTTTPAWAGALASQATGEYFSSLPESAGSRLIAAGQRLSLDGYASLSLPMRTGAPTAPLWVGEGQPIPARAYSIAAAVLGPTSKLAVLSLISRELARSSAAEAVISTLLREDAALGLDAALFSSAAAIEGESPAGLLAGVTPIAAAAGGGIVAMEADLTALAGAVTAAGAVSIVLVAAPAQAAAIAIRKPELLIPVWPSAALGAGTIVAIDPRSFASAIGPDVEISASSETVVHADTAPLQISSGEQGSATVAAPSYSAFQSDLIALRMIAQVAYAMRRPGGIAVITDATW